MTPTPPRNPGPSRRIAVVPAYNEEPTVAAGLDRQHARRDRALAAGAPERAPAPPRDQPGHVRGLLPRLHRPQAAGEGGRALAGRPHLYGGRGWPARAGGARRSGEDRARRTPRRADRAARPLHLPGL